MGEEQRMSVIAWLMILMGVAIATIWTHDIVAGQKIDRSPGLLHARDEDGSLFWPHWLAEYATAVLLVVGGVGLLADTAWGRTVAGLALGALFYTSVNSLGWAFAEPDRYAYAVPMTAGVVVSVAGAIGLLAG